MKGIKPNNT
jgi:hypothetical protein